MSFIKSYVTTITDAGVEISSNGVVHDFFVGNCDASVEFSNHAVIIRSGALQAICDTSDIGFIIDNLVIPEQVEIIEPGAFAELEDIDGHIIVDKYNKYYKAEDDVIFTKDGKILVYCSVGKDDEEYEIPYGVEDIVSDAFYFSKIETVVIPSTVKYIHPDAFLDSEVSLIIGEPGSVAEKFAEEAGYDFEELY